MRGGGERDDGPRVVAFGDPAGGDLTTPTWGRGHPRRVRGWLPGWSPESVEQGRAAASVDEPEPEVTAASEPQVTAETEPLVTAETEPEVTAETEPLVTAAPEPLVAAAPEPGPPGVPEEEVEARILAAQQELIAVLQAPYEEGAAKLAAAARELDNRVHQDLVQLALELAQEMVERVIELDPSVVLDVAKRAVRRAGPVQRLVVKCSEHDAAFLRDQLPGVAKQEGGRAVEVLVRPSDDIRPGGVLLTFSSGIVDARMEKGLSRLAEAVRAALSIPDAERADAQRARQEAAEAAEAAEGTARSHAEGVGGADGGSP